MNKTDVILLDFIIEKALFKSSVKAEDLINEKLLEDKNILNFNDNYKYNPVDKFTKLSYIIKQYEVANVTNTNDGTIITSNEKTEIFRNSGGFKKIYNENKTKNKKEKLELEKSKIDLVLSKKILKEYPYTKWFARISIVIAVTLAILEIARWKDK